MSFFKGSPRRRSNNDMEARGSPSGGELIDEDESSSDPFDITSTKNASIERLRRWRQAALVLNASRRFRYTLDLKRAEERKQRLRTVRVHVEAIRAANLFKAGVAPENGTAKPPPTPSGDFGIGQEHLALTSRDHNVSSLQEYGGVKGLSDLLKTNLEKGIQGDEPDLQKRRNAFGSNTYPRKKGRSFWMFLWEAWQDLTLIILMVAAVASLALGIKTEGIKEGWYDGGSIAFAVILVIVVTAVSDYKQSLQFQNLNEEKRNIHMEVIRGGRRIEISIYDIVVGDVVPLNIGDQVPADGVLISGHSLAVDESSMTGESKIVKKAILSWGLKLGMSFEAIRSESSVIQVFPFNSEKKRGGVALKLPDGQVHIHWKGAAEIVLASCTRFIDATDQLVAMDEDKVKFFKKAIEIMAVSSLRCVAIAYRSCESEEVPSDEEQLAHWSLPENDLVLLAIVGIKDPCRPGVKGAVQLCQNAGVKVRMVTGDNIQTAKAIALEAGILDSAVDATEPNLIEGPVFRALSDAERENIADKISVMGRSSPNDKLLLVQALRKKGHVVAVTGDGTNDAPALHEADIGLAMGIAGTEVAKESSDIIILDDNFASVVKVVRWGRSVYANIQKFIQFQLTVNVAALIINVVAAVSSGAVPLNAVQLLWVNLIMDTLGALALATEPPTDHLMHRPPVGRREPLITNIMWRNLLIQALYQVIVLLILHFQGRSLLNLEQYGSDRANKMKNTLIFNSFVLCQVFNEFNARKPDELNIFKGITKNYLFMGIVGLTIVLQVLIIEFLGKFTTTVKLNWSQWLISVIIGFMSWPLAVVGKLIPVPETPLSKFFHRGRRT
ncbi:hypothetical protein I3760_08G032000 [Carya illinoinensis]|uniref:Calcium-transporting ATPase n=1 Tax=Carya illinoinensis TaxID=32201 RepID=A0A922JBK1_CARIL|nr:hypothetical protein I3760_08G032000 [Carya illinoinensis]KAG6698679.1 hypothetical protein I3842_08G031700 [Carya illinoinensis]